MHSAKHWHRSPRVCGRFCGPWSPGCVCSLRGWGPGSILVGGSLSRRNARSGPVGTSRAWQRVWPWPPRSAPGVDVDRQASDVLGAAGPHEPDKETSASYRRMARAENLGARRGLNGAFLCPFGPPPSPHLCVPRGLAAGTSLPFSQRDSGSTRRWVPSVLTAESQCGGRQAGPRGAAPPHLHGGTIRHPGLRSLRQWAPGGRHLAPPSRYFCLCLRHFLGN